MDFLHVVTGGISDYQMSSDGHGSIWIVWITNKKNEQFKIC